MEKNTDCKGAEGGVQRERRVCEDAEGDGDEYGSRTREIGTYLARNELSGNSGTITVSGSHAPSSAKLGRSL